MADENQTEVVAAADQVSGSKLTTWEAEVLRLEARVAELERDPNQLPMELLPEGWTILRLNLYPDSGDWGCILENRNNEPMTVGYSSTPRAAMLAAIERIPSQRD